MSLRMKHLYVLFFRFFRQPNSLSFYQEMSLYNYLVYEFFSEETLPLQLRRLEILVELQQQCIS